MKRELLRWAYEIIPGHEGAVLEFLYEFLPYSVQQMAARAVEAGMEERKARRSIVDVWRYGVRDIAATGRAARSRRRAAGAFAELTTATHVLTGGPFSGVPLASFRETMREWVARLTDELTELRATIGRKGEWTVTLPTHGVYADLALGKCSGAEDYYEIQRHLELETKRAEIEKLRAQVESLRLANQLLQSTGGTTTLALEGAPDGGTVNINLTLTTPPASLAIKPASS